MSRSVQEEPLQNAMATVDDDRTGIKVETLKQAILENLRYVMGKDPEFATGMDYFMAVAYTVRDRILARWLATRRSYSEHNVRLVCYLSAEFLMGPHLANNLLNLGVEDPIRQATKELGLDLDRIIAARERAWTRQRRARASRGMLPGFFGYAGSSRHWSRYSLRIRYVPPGDS